MPTRSSTVVRCGALALIAVALAAVLSACASSARDAGSAPRGPSLSYSPGHAQSPSPPAVTATVILGAAFNPRGLRLLVGQAFLLTVSPSTQATGQASPPNCPPGATRQVAGGLLSMRCTTSGYLYTAQQPGAATLTASVRPHCTPGSVCPQWMTQPSLRITIS